MADETGDGAGTPATPSTPGAEHPSPEPTYTFSWPTVDPADTPAEGATSAAAATAAAAPVSASALGPSAADAPAVGAPAVGATRGAGGFASHDEHDDGETADVVPPPRRRRTRAAAVAAVVVAALGVGGTALAVNGRAPEPTATSSPTPDRSPTPSPAPTVTLVDRSLLTSLDDVLTALVAQLEESGTVWTRTDGQVNDADARDRLRTVLDAASTWLTDAWEPHDAAHARALAAEGREHLEAIDALTATVLQDHDAWVTARSGVEAGGRDASRDGRPASGTALRGSGSDGSGSGGAATDPGTGAAVPGTSNPGTDPGTNPGAPDPGHTTPSTPGSPHPGSPDPGSPDPGSTTPPSTDPTTPAPDPGGETAPIEPDPGSGGDSTTP